MIRGITVPSRQMDISAEMLGQAAGKGVYRRLVEADLTAGTELDDATYAAVVSSGTFTHGHLPPDPIAELIRIARPGARFAIGVNAAHFAEFGFGAWLDHAAERGLIEPYERHRVKVYEGSDPGVLDDMSDVVVFHTR